MGSAFVEAPPKKNFNQSMSFQGDVGGIGLAELLQSLARGRREGVLTLIGRGKLHSTIGLEHGMVYFLPDPDEDPAVWRHRAARSWADYPDFRVDYLRMSEIARAHRIEVLYQLLDSEGVHFRFTPGPLPKQGADGSREGVDPIHCQASPVEMLLLEYARLVDEAKDIGASELRDDFVPRLLELSAATADMRRFCEECTGASDLTEIADRLGWPLRQVRNALAVEMRRGSVRLTQPREMLALVQRELASARYERAATRLGTWLRDSFPGTPAAGDGDLLIQEWKSHRLQRTLEFLPVETCRSLLRRMEGNRFQPSECAAHWIALNEIHRYDRIVELHVAVQQHRDVSEPDMPPIRDLLTIARAMRDAGNLRRAGVVLRMALDRTPPTNAMMLEIGMGLLAAGHVEDGAPWVYEACSTFVTEEAYEKAISPLRTLIELDPHHRDARALLQRVRRHTVKSRVVGKHAVIALAFVLALGLTALVRFRVQRDRAQRLDEVAEVIDQPSEAEILLERYFHGDQSEEVERLRTLITDKRRGAEAQLRDAWNDLFKEAQLECTLGDFEVGFRRAMELPAPPKLSTLKEPWPLVTDLLNSLVARIEKSVTDLGAVADSPEQEQAEQQAVVKINELIEVARKEEASDMIDAFVARLEAARKLVSGRQQTRLAQREKTQYETHIAQCDRLLAKARSYFEGCDVDRSARTYEELFEVCPQVRALVKDEYGDAKRMRVALEDARRLASEGRHDEATDKLHELANCEGFYPLPWKVDSFPPGAQVTIDGEVRETPFMLESRPGEAVKLRVEYEGYDTITITVREPDDQHLHLSKTPERYWPTGAEVDAPPVAVDGDHIVCDRSGRLLRLGESSKVVWEEKLPALGGVARAPVFLPKRPDHLLLITEDGEAWIVNAKDGSLEGPWATDSPPVRGPVVVGDEVACRFADGRVLAWKSGIKPRSSGADVRQGYGSDAGLAMLRREAGSVRFFESPWTPHTVAVLADEPRYEIRDASSGELLFTVSRSGEWQFVAWESPRPEIPKGRLWVSDREGLRAFVP